MAQRQTVSVLAVEPRQSQSGKGFWRVRTDSGVYFVWEKAIADQLAPGTTAVVSINGSADYPKIVAVHEAPEPPSNDAPASPAPAPPAPAGDRERRMLRMSALRAAAEVLHGSGVEAGALIDYAEQLLAWLEA